MSSSSLIALHVPGNPLGMSAQIDDCPDSNLLGSDRVKNGLFDVSSG